MAWPHAQVAVAEVNLVFVAVGVLDGRRRACCPACPDALLGLPCQPDTLLLVRIVGLWLRVGVPLFLLRLRQRIPRQRCGVCWLDRSWLGLRIRSRTLGWGRALLWIICGLRLHRKSGDKGKDQERIRQVSQTLTAMHVW